MLSQFTIHNFTKSFVFWNLYVNLKCVFLITEAFKWKMFVCRPFLHRPTRKVQERRSNDCEFNLLIADRIVNHKLKYVD